MIMRRYKQGEHRHYDEVFNEQLKRNTALSGNMNDISSGLHTIDGKRGRIAQLEGMGTTAANPGKHSRHYYYNYNYWPSRLLELEQQEAEIKKQFADIQEQHRKRGEKIPQEMHPELQDKMHEIEAKRDVYQAELKKLRELVRIEGERTDTVHYERVTALGLFFDKKFNGDGLLISVGGIPVTECETGELVFAEGVYEGCLVHEVSSAFNEARSKQHRNRFKSREDWPDCKELKRYKH